MNNGGCEVRDLLREAVSVRARTLLEARARSSTANGPGSLSPSQGELWSAIEAYRTALREFESHVGQHRCE